jgi:hypothetical protein
MFKELLLEGNINKANWEGLINNIKKTRGFKSMRFDKLYGEDVLIIEYGNVKQALKAKDKLMNDTIDIGAFGDELSSGATDVGPAIIVWLNDDALAPLNNFKGILDII